MADREQTPEGGRASAIASAAEAFHEAVFDLDVLLHIVAERISSATGDFCSVALVSPDGRRFQPLVAYHADPQLVEDSRQFLGVSMDIEASGVWTRVFKDRKPLVIQIDPDHLPADMAPHQVLHMKRWRIREAALLPLIARDQLVGGLNLNRLEGSPPFSAEDIELLESLGVLAARAISNARLLQAQRQTSGELERKVKESSHEAEARAVEARVAVARLQAALNTPLSTVVIATDIDGTVTAFNAGAELLLGYKAAEVVGTATPALFMAGESARGFAGLAAGLSSSGAAQELLFKARSGEEKPVELTISAVAGRGGDFTGYLLVARDISERKALETDLQAAIAEGRDIVAPAVARHDEVADLARSLASWERFSRQRLEGSQAMSELSSMTRVEDITEVGLSRLAAIFDALHGSICLLQPDGIRVGAVLHGDQPADEFRVGASLGRGTPIAKVAAASTPIVDQFGAGNWSESARAWASSIGAGPMLVLPLISGARVVAVLVLIRGLAGDPFTDSEVELAGAVSAPVAAALEVSRLIAELRRSNAELSDASLHKSQFLANMSHELRTPLTAILGFSQLLIDDVSGRIDPATRVRFLDRISSSGKHLLALINDVLDLSKVEAGQMELQLADTSVAEVFESVVNTIEPLAADKGITLVAEPAADLRLTVDPAKFKQILINLLSNGVKFTPTGGNVTLLGKQVGTKVEVRVRDTGIGMTAADLKLIFKEFKQLDQGPGRKQEGTGLGLALSRRFAELHEGTLDAVSAPGVGSTFILRLPLEGPRAQAASASVPVAPADPSRPLLLVVEDNPEAAELLATHLIAGGFRVETARTGPEALLKARELRPVAITLDILLPELDGWEVLARLKHDAVTRDIPVVIASVVDNQGLGRALGAIDYLVKPIDPQSLLAKLERFRLAGWRSDEPLRVLLVDDEPDNLDFLEGVLGPAGMTVIRASGGQEGIEKARTESPNLVLLDLMMPDVTGFDVVEALRAEEATRTIPIVVLTAKQLTDEDKNQLNGYVSGVFERKSLAGAELIGWLHDLVGA